ncbi:putative methyltransferase PMT2, partial [Cocos nucifera]|nr:putative methyltransferase PMT2 [Cocos nucifera]
PPSNAKYSEYTPCNDLAWSLEFLRDQLIYREQHCPTKGEELRCLIVTLASY